MPEIDARRKIQEKFHYYRVSNGMLLGNSLALLLGDWLAKVMFEHRAGKLPEDFLTQLAYVDFLYGAFCALALSLAVILYERPIRKCLKLFHHGRIPGAVLLEAGQRRVLNAPFYILFLDIVVWSLGAFLFWYIGTPAGAGVGVAGGLITLTFAFFWMEHLSQHRLVPLFFPDGGLSQVEGVISIGLKIRFIALIIAVSVVPLSFIHITIHKFRNIPMRDEMNLPMLVGWLEQAIAVESFLFMGVAVLLSWMVVHNIQKPVGEIIRVMGRVKKGDFSQRAAVFSNDEIGFAGETLNAMTQGLQEREKIKEVFGRYVDKDIRDEILKGKISLDGQRMEATILFADLRDFTPLVAVTPPKELIYVLNSYFNEMALAIRANGGLILQFIGDEVEAVFGAPVARPGHEGAAVRAALDMRIRLSALNKRFQREGIPPIAHGVGIHTGPVLAANIGSYDRSAYSLIGDTVNLTSRIQGLTKEKGTDILVSGKIQNILKDHYSFLPIPAARVKGKSEPVQVFGVKERLD